MNKEVERLLNKFNMKPHPEGGYFGAGYRSNEFLRSDCLPKRYSTPRNLYSSIYFLVTPENPSFFHRLKTDEIWHYYKGDPMQIHLIWEQGKYSSVILSNNQGNEKFQTLVKRNTWMAASCAGTHGYSLVGCTLGPGFEYTDFELAKPANLIEAYPEHSKIIKLFTGDQPST